MPEVDLEDLIADAGEDPGEDDLDEGEEAGPDVTTEEVDSEETAPDDDAGELVEDDADEEDEGEQDDLESEEEPGEDPGETEEEQADPRDQEIAQLKFAMQQQANQVQQLVAHLEGRQQPAAAPKGPDPQLREALTAFYAGGEPEEVKATLSRLSPQSRSRAADMVREAERKKVEYMLNPGQRYGDEMAGFVEDHIRQVMAPYIQQVQQTRLGDVLARYSGVLKTQEDKDAVADILAEMPQEGWQGGVEARIKMAAELYSARQGRTDVNRQKKQLRGKEKDIRAKREARRGTRRRPKRGKKKAPEFGKDASLSQIAAHYRENGVDMQELRDMGLLD